MRLIIIQVGLASAFVDWLHISIPNSPGLLCLYIFLSLSVWM